MVSHPLTRMHALGSHWGGSLKRPPTPLNPFMFPPRIQVSWIRQKKFEFFLLLHEFQSGFSFLNQQRREQALFLYFGIAEKIRYDHESG